MTTIEQRLASAVQQHQAGRLQEAEILYRGILDEAPRHPHALHLLGVLACQAGRHAEAIDLIGRALAIHGPHPVFHSNLATVYLAAGRLDEAVALCREALRLRPDFADAHTNLGIALRRQGHVDESVGAFREALRHNPNHLDARCNLGAALQQQGRLAEPAAVLQDTVRLVPGHAQARNNWGDLLRVLGRPAEAEGHLREALCLRPAFAEAHFNLGLALRDLDRADEAAACFREAVRLSPEDTRARNQLAHALEVQGKAGEALAELQETLRLRPANATALYGLSKLAAAGHYRLSDDELRRMRELAARPDLPPSDLCPLHFALGRLFDQAGARADAFAHYRRANEQRQELNRRRGVAFDRVVQRQLVDRLSAAFTPAYFERVRPFGLGSELPVFIVGMLRSGTTLAEQILASHPLVHGAGELPDMTRLVNSLPAYLQTAGPDKVRAPSPEGATGPATQTAGYPECVGRLGAPAVRAMAEDYLHQLRERGGTAARVVDKMPFNFLHLGVVTTLFPKARIIYCRRDPRDTCLSCYFQNFVDPHPFTTDLRQLGEYYLEYERLMAHWARVLPVPLFELRYEALTADPEAVSRRLLTFCGLEWDERCLRFHETRRVVRTSSLHQVRQPLYQSSVGRWQAYADYLGPLLEVLREGKAEMPTDGS